ncbi:MAG: hypothetical protein IPM89_15020 [Candidatus Competibacteraceae bacterium]|nr:MAG: hypothetical protein IPM89_15020 [Candidatus Competibacteraceae bacterium]
MSEQVERQHPQFTIHAAEATIPRYQRAWVWGVVALAILLCGIVVGWLASGTIPGLRHGIQPNPQLAIDGTALTRQQALNEGLRARIVRLEQALAGDACDPEALEALTRSRREP